MACHFTVLKCNFPAIFREFLRTKYLKEDQKYSAEYYDSLTD